MPYHTDPFFYAQWELLYVELLFFFVSLPGSCVELVLSTWTWRSCSIIRSRSLCSCTSRSSTLEYHGYRYPGLRWPYPGESKSCTTPGETQENRGEVEKNVSLSGMSEIFQQSGEVEGALIFSHRRKTILLFPPWLQQGFCLQIQAATVQASSSTPQAAACCSYFYTFFNFSTQ